MVKKTAGAFSIYRHVNQRQRARKHPFDVQDSPTPSPEAEQNPSSVFTQPTPAPSQQQTPRDIIDASPRIKVEEDSLFVPLSNTPPPMNPPAGTPPAVRLAVNKATIEAVSKVRTKLVQAQQKPKPVRRVPSESSEEAEEALPAEEVDIGSRTLGVSSAALYRKEQSPPKRPTKDDEVPATTAQGVEPEQSAPLEQVDQGEQPDQTKQTEAQLEPETIEQEPVEPEAEVYGEEHRKFFMQTRRSLRGRRCRDGEHLGTKMHIEPPENFFDLCDEDEIWGKDDDDDAASLPVRHSRKSVRTPRKDTPHEVVNDELMGFDPMDFEQSPSLRVRSKYAPAFFFDRTFDAHANTAKPLPKDSNLREQIANTLIARSMAPPSSKKSKSSPTAAVPQSDAEAQKMFVAWTGQLITKNEELDKRLEVSEARVEELKAVISIKDEDMEKLQTKVQTLKRKAQHNASNEAQVATLKSQVATLQEQLTEVNDEGREYKKRCIEQDARITEMTIAQGVEKNKSDKQIQDLQRQVSTLKSQSRAPPTAPAAMSSPRVYQSPLRNSINRNGDRNSQSNGFATPSPPSAPRTPTVDAGKYKALHDSASKVLQNGASMIGDNFGTFGQALNKLKDEVEREPKVEG